ncbi:sensor histidine kinase [Intrasporangium mesophilum]
MRRGWLVTLGAVGTASLLYVFVVRGFVDVGPLPGEGLGWPLVGVLPLYAFGLWLLTATSSRFAVYVALGATAMAVSAAYETAVERNPEVLTWSGFPLLNSIGLTSDALATIGFLLMIATFPNGVLEHAWQRVACRLLWLQALVAPLTLLTTPQVVMTQYIGVQAAIPNPYAVPALEWAAPVVDALLVQAGPALVLGIGVLYSRAFFGTPKTRAQLRLLAWAATFALVAFGIWAKVPELGLDGGPLGWISQVAVFVGLFMLPAACIHGILRYGAFDIALADRGRAVVRSSTVLITVLYGIAVAAPVVLISDKLTAVSAALLSAVLAVALLPVRGWLERAIHRAVFGDRDHHLALLSELGARLEQAVELDEVLTRLAQSLRDGLDATWVRIRLLGSDGEVTDSSLGVAGETLGDPVVVHDLTQGDARLGRIEVGPGRHGDYSLAELTLLGTVARQATTAVSNVHLTAQLAEQLDELTASRVRLITAQDAERRRIERDLHDGIQQNVVALIASLRLARNRLDRGTLRREELSELQDQARETLADLRELAHGIHPQVLSDSGLVAAIESRTTRFPVPLTIEADDELRSRRFDPDVETVAFYTIREALSNVAKHANASRVRVALSRNETRLRVMVSDDGMGFDPGAGVDAHAGLANIRDRVAAVHGHLHVSSAPGRGTQIVVDLPIEPETVTESPTPEPANA